MKNVMYKWWHVINREREGKRESGSDSGKLRKLLRARVSGDFTASPAKSCEYFTSIRENRKSKWPCICHLPEERERFGICTRVIFLLTSFHRIDINTVCVCVYPFYLPVDYLVVSMWMSMSRRLKNFMHHLFTIYREESIEFSFVSFRLYSFAVYLSVHHHIRFTVH